MAAIRTTGRFANAVRVSAVSLGIAVVAWCQMARTANADAVPAPTATRSPLAYANCHAEELTDVGRDGEIDERVSREYDSRGAPVRVSEYVNKGPGVSGLSYSAYDDQLHRTGEYHDSGADGTIDSGTRWSWQAGRLVRIDYLGGSELRVQHSWRYVRDDQDRVVAEISELSDGTQTVVTRYHYPGSSSLATRVESDWAADGSVDPWEYRSYSGESLSKVTAYDVLWQGGDQPQSIDIYRYNDRDLLARIHTLWSNTCRDWATWTYNEHGWLSEGTSTRGCGGTGALQRYRCDDLGRIKAMSNGGLKDVVGTLGDGPASTRRASSLVGPVEGLTALGFSAMARWADVPAERPAPAYLTTYHYSCGVSQE